MATIEEFESTLKEVVNGKRLSASKMGKLTDLSMKLMENDTQLVSLMYRTHKSLRASSKISSLYCFDALCRAARAYAVKHKQTGDANAVKGNAASFLLKIEGVLDGLFQDIHSSGVPEAKDKTKKILDIWTKSNTFPADVLTRLSVLGKKSETPKETPQPSTSTLDPRKQPTPPQDISHPTISTPPNAESAKAALLALLSTAAATNQASQISINTGLPSASSTTMAAAQPQLDSSVLLLQQLAKISSNVGAHPQERPNPMAPANVPFSPTVATPTSAQPNSNFFPGTSSHLHSEENYERNSDYSKQSRFDNGPGPGRNYDRDRDAPYNQRRGSYRRDSSPSRGDHYTRDGQRGGSRFSGGRERSKDYGSRNWNNKDDRWRSRSRSPQHYRSHGGQDGRQPYSPRRTSFDRPRGMSESGPGPGKDEFGRDIRTPSEEPEQSNRPTDPRRPAGYQPPKSEPKPQDLDTSPNTRNVKPSSFSQQEQPSLSGPSGTGGLETFDMTAFDPTNANSWQALGESYKITNGYIPSQEELMEFVMSSMNYMMSMGMGQMGNVPVGQDETGAGGISAQDWGAETYGGGTQGPLSNFDMASDTSGTNVTLDGPDTGDDDESNKSGGKMEKVGDRWVFVRN